MRTAFHDPLIIPTADGYLGLSTDLAVPGVQCRTSRDLITWSDPFPLLGDAPASVRRHAHTNRFWAPELVQRGDCWRLYCCASQPGRTQSVIGLAEARDPRGPYTYVGDVIRSAHGENFTHANCIDPCVIPDRAGQDHLIYGSFFGGIRILPLNDEGFPTVIGEGTLIAGGGHRAVEGAYAFYHAPSDRYILFTSWGDLGCDYHIRVGYSHDLTGPYLDAQGYPLTDPDPIHIPGDKICGGYNFDTPELPGVMATGHNSLLQLSDALYMVHHARPEGDRRRPFLQIRRLLFTPDGRVMAWPLTYDGQPLVPCSAIPDRLRVVYHSRSNAGVVYGRSVTARQAQCRLEDGMLQLELFHQSWQGYLFQQGERIACSLISPRGESLWGVAEP